MNFTSSKFNRCLATAVRDGFTLVELLVVIGIIAILMAIAVPLFPSLLKASSIDSNVNTLAGILEEARESATAGNTYVWVAFTSAIAGSNSPAKATWVATIQSLDGTETGVNTGTPTAPVWTTAITIPGGNLLLHSKLQSLPGVALSKAATLPASLTNAGNTNIPSNFYDLLASETPVFAWNITTLSATGAGTGVTFSYAIEFTPNGEAHVPSTSATWSANTQFGMVSATGTTTTNAVLFNISRLTGKTTVYRM